MRCRNRVADFEEWRSVFDANAGPAREAGLRLTNPWRDEKDLNHVFFLFEVENIDGALAFISDPAALESGKASGVLDGECPFLETSTGG